MAMRSRTTFKKRQKELARQEKQRDKAAKRLERKLHKGTGDGLSDQIEEGISDEEDSLQDDSIQENPLEHSPSLG